MRYISRGSHEEFRRCPRSGYWRYLSGPFGEDSTLGLEAPIASPHYAIGIAWHLAAEGLLRGEPGVVAVKPALAFAVEQGLGSDWQEWLLAATLAFERSALPTFQEKYEVVSIEEELLTPLTSNVQLYTRADAILRERLSGDLWVLNWKTAREVKDWNKKWFYDIQAWTESLAAEAKLGEPVRGCIFYGIWKGPIYQGTTTSRLIYGYRYSHPGGSTSYGTENSGSGKRFRVAEETFPFGEGLAAWINWLPEDFLRKHFVESAPQIRQDELVEGWLRQVVGLESDIDHVLAEGSPQDKLDFFWQNWGEDTCSRCAYAPLCTLKAGPEELIAEGLLRPRKASPRDELEAKENASS